MGMKPDNITEKGWRHIVRTVSVEDIFVIGNIAEENHDKVKRLVRVARREDDNQRQAMQEAEIQDNFSGDTLTNPSDLQAREKQTCWDHLLPCLFPWTQKNSQIVAIDMDVIAPLGKLDGQAGTLAHPEVVPPLAPRTG